MTEKPSDDIFALCSRFNLDQESYRVFPKRELIAVSSNSPEPTSIAVPAELKPERSSADDTRLPVEQDNAIAAQTSRTALRNLWRHIERSENRGKVLSFQELLQSSVFVYGAAGGVGATTISATLARLLAKTGRSCAIVDDHSESVLPFYFGEQRSALDQRRFAGLHAASDIPVRIIARQTHDSDIAEGESEACWLQRSICSVQKYLDHLIVDVQRGQEPTLPASATPVALLVAVPDVSSLVGARALKRILNEKASASQLICVLNKFDSTLTLHGEIREWFQENFSQVLTLGRSDLINEALAEGLTIVDWKPQSTVAADFLRVFNTVQKMMPASFNCQHHGEPSLCL